MKTSMRYLAVIFAVAMLVLTFTVSASSFTDVTSQTPHYKAIDTLTSYGIIHGYEDNTYRPDLPVRRDEMAKLVYVTATTSVDAGDGVVTFPDVNKNSWAKGYISWCAAKSIVGGYEDGTFRPEGNITYDEALKMVCAVLGYTDFNPGLWPTDVRVKALIDLNLGEGLDDVAGDAVLTRAQVAQIFVNALDEPMYIPPVDKDQIGKPIFETQVAPSTLGEGVWGYTTIEAKIVATENWGLHIYGDVLDGAEVKIEKRGTEAKSEDLRKVDAIRPQYVDIYKNQKTDSETKITVAFLDENGKPVVTKKGTFVKNGNAEEIEYGTIATETIKLEDLNLSSYEGKSDEILGYVITIIKDKDGKYVSSQLKGVTVKGIGTGSMSVSGLDDSQLNIYPVANTGTPYAKYAMTINGKVHKDEDFHKVRRIVYSQDGSGDVYEYPSVDGEGWFFVNADGSIMNNTTNTYSSFAGSSANNPFLMYKRTNFAWLGRMGYVGYKEAIDADGDGYYDYVLMSPKTAYEVTDVTKKKITLKGIYAAYADHGNPSDPYTHTYLLENYNSLVIPEKGDVVLGYFIGEEFYCEDTVQKITAFATKVSGGKYTLYGYGTYGFAELEPGRIVVSSILTKLVNKINSTSSFIGFDANKGDYNYLNYYIYNGNIIHATEASDADVSSGAINGGNKAILQYVDKATEPQINEKTKQYEVFYPAYLIINGKEQLVNLKATDAINGAEAAMVSQDGSMYRAYTKDGILMYRNILVEFKVDEDGYYSLTTSKGDSEVIEDGVAVEKVIAANETNEFGEIKGNKGYQISIDKDLGLMSILDKNGATVVDRIIADASTIIYYTYTNEKKTGDHEFVNFYLGNEIPAEFADTTITGDIYLTRQKESGLWILGTTMIGIDGFKEVADKVADDYKTDARLHFIALEDSWAEYDATDKEVYANYNFKNLYEGTDTTAVNKEDKFDNVGSVSTAGIYAWDATIGVKDYVLVDNGLKSYEEEVITEVLDEFSLVFTDKSVDGLKIEEDTNLYAIKNIPDSDDEIFEIEEITVGDIGAVLETLETVNTVYSKSLKLNAKIGYYVDEDDATRVAYIIIDWVEYDEENDEITIAGTTSSLL